jgi:hypothetical protein
VGCVFSDQRKHHPGKWLGGAGDCNNKFDCCSSSGGTVGGADGGGGSSGNDGCTPGPQPQPLRSAAGF